MSLVEYLALFGSYPEWECTFPSDGSIICPSVDVRLPSLGKHQALRREKSLFRLLEPSLYEVYLFCKEFLVCSEKLGLLRLRLLVDRGHGPTEGLHSLL